MITAIELLDSFLEALKKDPVKPITERQLCFLRDLIAADPAQIIHRRRKTLARRIGFLTQNVRYRRYELAAAERTLKDAKDEEHTLELLG